jgi:GNAT superfamily N-acetyltransferase
VRPADLPGVRAVLARDPVWCAYALADLQPDVQPFCDWYMVQGDGDAAVVLLFGLLDPPVIFATGPGLLVAHILDAASLPPRIYMTARTEHLAAIATHYDFGTDVRSMWRMGLADAAKLAGPEVAGLQRLAQDDAPRMRRLYAHGGPFTPDAFVPYQVEGGVFYGVEDEEGELAAMGGTHIVDWEYGVAGIGNMYTRPDRRGRGYAGAVLRAISRELLERGVRNIVLNVDQRNTAAQRIYLAHGYVVHCGYVEGIGQQRELPLSADDADGHR